jgi:hypothetical protein
VDFCYYLRFRPLESFLIEQVANSEIARKSEIEKKLDFIARRLEQLKVITQLPDTIVPTDDLINRATDVRSACLKYIAVQIRHESQYFGLAGTYILLKCN